MDRKGGDREDEVPSIEEVSEAVKKSKNNRDPLSNGLRRKLL